MRPLHRLWRSRSLFLTGLADIWESVQQERPRGESMGLVLMVVSAAAFALMAAAAKGLLPDTPTQAVVLSRGILMTLLCAALAWHRGVSLLGQRPALLLLRGLLGYAALSCYFVSVQRLPLGDAVLLQYSHPVFVAAAAPFLLREPTGRDHWTWVALALAGVALIVGPSGELRGVALVGLSGSFLSGLAYLTVRDLSRTEHPLTILLWFPLATLPGALLGTMLAGQASLPRNGTEVLGHLAVFATALAGQFALTEGLARAGAARATAVSMSGPVFGVLFGLLFFGTPPTIGSIAGMLLVVVSLWRLARARPLA
jgi:drug/metabolite transporter (DMT)-like permease